MSIETVLRHRIKEALNSLPQDLVIDTFNSLDLGVEATLIDYPLPNSSNATEKVISVIRPHAGDEMSLTLSIHSSNGVVKEVVSPIKPEDSQLATVLGEIYFRDQVQVRDSLAAHHHREINTHLIVARDRSGKR